MALNLFKRVCRHLFIPPLALKKRFPKAVMQRIERAVAECEKTHFGEIDLPLNSICRCWIFLERKPVNKER